MGFLCDPVLFVSNQISCCRNILNFRVFAAIDALINPIRGLYSFPSSKLLPLLVDAAPHSVIMYVDPMSLEVSTLLFISIVIDPILD